MDHMMIKILPTSLMIMCLAVLSLQYQAVDPYMDEIFHVPQAMQYCDGNLSYWDPKITTFPGIYLFSAGAYKLISYPLREIFGIHVTCSFSFLRLMNTVLSAISPFLYSACRRKVRPTAGDSTLIGILLFLYPVNFFYYFLYYTDTASTLSVVMVYYLAFQPSNQEDRVKETKNLNKYDGIKKSKIMGYKAKDLLRYSSYQILLLIASCVSVLIRQTNAIWLLFIAGTMMLSHLEQKNIFRDSPVISIEKISDFLLKLLRNSSYLLLVTWPILVPIVFFAAFVLFNKGIVVGDKDHHQPVVHMSMPLHACGILTLLLLPIIIDDVYTRMNNKSKQDLKIASNAIRNREYQWLFHFLGLSMVTLILQFSCLSHPFLLADNRHYSFYIWARVLSKPIYRLFLSPLYYTCSWWSLSRLVQGRGFIWLSIYVVALVVTLVPAHLLELRYFTPAIVIAVINLPEIGESIDDNDLTNKKNNHVNIKNDATSWIKVKKIFFFKGIQNRKYLILMSIFYCCIINMITIHVFLYRNFTWNDATTARFMY
mmetsp:Transcript_19534/g.18868  ORF Transcript_19534/g.18868 Transcript_19534/m.18868 type:complete len:540 (+) Transcript_19534:194-1813(+)